MGNAAQITHERFPVQSSRVGTRVAVCYHYNTAHQHEGMVLRDDAQMPHVTVIRLDNGHVVLGTECQYRFL